MMRVLIAEDDPVTCRLLEVGLSKLGYEVIVARNGIEAWQIMQSKEAPQLVILDWVMPGIDGIEVCLLVRKQAKEPYAYIIMLTSKDRKEDIVAGIEAGADDYITKPFDQHELKVRLSVGRRIVELEAKQIAAREGLRIQATCNPLTSLWNRRAIMDILPRELARAQREDANVGIIMADLDHFKHINDKHGHLTGDTVLCEVAQRMRSVVRPYDAIGRWGGEEFLIIFPGCNEVTVKAKAEKMRTLIAENDVEITDGLISITASLGVATYNNGHGQVDSDALILAADAALYRAKTGGRNCVELATSKEIKRGGVYNETQ